MRNLVYLFVTWLSSLAIFITLLPHVKNVVYSKCVWKLNFAVCDRFIGIEAAYRLTVAVVLFYFLLSVATLNFSCCRVAAWLHHEGWVLKLVLFITTNLLAFLIPVSQLLFRVLFSMFLFGAASFICIMFVLSVDSAHAFRLLWLQKAHEHADVPTCYMCTWLFLLHLGTSFLYAISLDIILAFLFFNDVRNCVNTFAFLSLNVFLCLCAFGVSYIPTLRRRECSSQIVFASVLFTVVLTTWFALSDPNNEGCNMYGTIFTGSLLESALSFRSVVSVLVSIPLVAFLCLKHGRSYARSLLTDSSSEDSLFAFTPVHVTMMTYSCYVLMSLTNYYQPMHVMFTPNTHAPARIRTSVVYFEGYNRMRFLLLMTTSSLLPIFYILALVTRLIKDCVRTKQEVAQVETPTEMQSVLSEATEEFLYVKISRRKANDMLKRNSSAVVGNPASSNLDYVLLPCFRITEMGLSFWLFPRHLSQTYFSGRNGSNACTIISMIFGRFFSRSEIAYQNIGYLSDTWLNLFHSSIEEGSTLYDFLVKQLGVLDLCVEEVHEKYGAQLNVDHVHPSLAVAFDSDVETVTVLFQLRRLVALHMKQVLLLIHRARTSAFLVYEDGNLIYVDSHAYGANGALLIACAEENIAHLVDFLRDILGSNNNKLATLTPVDYEKRFVNRLYPTLHYP